MAKCPGCPTPGTSSWSTQQMGLVWKVRSLPLRVLSGAGRGDSQITNGVQTASSGPASLVLPVADHVPQPLSLGDALGIPWHALGDALPPSLPGPAVLGARSRPSSAPRAQRGFSKTWLSWVGKVGPGAARMVVRVRGIPGEHAHSGVGGGLRVPWPLGLNHKGHGFPPVVSVIREMVANGKQKGFYF